MKWEKYELLGLQIEQLAVSTDIIHSDTDTDSVLVSGQLLLPIPRQKPFQELGFQPGALSGGIITVDISSTGNIPTTHSMKIVYRCYM